MLYVVPEGVPLVAEHCLLNLLVILQVEGVSDVFAYSSFESFNHGPIVAVEYHCRLPKFRSVTTCCLACGAGLMCVVELVQPS